MTTTAQNSRIGRRMQAVASYVTANPGQYMIQAAGYVGPHGSLRYGYATVHRALRAGIVRAIAEHGGSRARLYPVAQEV
jgi:hypothetical protein